MCNCKNPNFYSPYFENGPCRFCYKTKVILKPKTIDKNEVSNFLSFLGYFVPT